MCKTLPLLLVLLLFSVVSQAQTHTFTFGPFTSSNSGCAEFQTLDGQPANEATGFAGEVCFPYNENPYWGIEAPQVWGFPNEGFLTNNNNSPSSLSAPVFTQPGCNLKTAGCVNYETGTSAFTGYGGGVIVEVTVWSVVNKHSHFGRGCYPCVYYTNDETNGSGTAAN